MPDSFKGGRGRWLRARIPGWRAADGTKRDAREPINQEALDVVSSGSRGPAFRPPRRSLLGEVLDWMLAPLFLLWPMSVAITYVVAQNIADQPYDQALSHNLLVLEQQLTARNNEAVLDMSPPARAILRANETESVFWLVLGSRGEYLGGDRLLPIPDADAPTPMGVVRYADASLRGFGLRLAYKRVDLGLGAPRAPTIVVAETVERRTQLANDIIKGVIIPQFIVLPVAVLLVWFGLSRGIAPLNALQRRLRARQPDDLSPMDERTAPTEIAPLLVAMNELLLRQSQTVETQRRFVADAAHQLKTPLAGLRTQAELALRDASPDEMQSSLRQLVTGSERATRLVNQLLQLANAENPAAIGLVEVDLNALAYEQTTHWAPHAMGLGTDIGFEGTDAPALIQGQPLLLGELINNLLDNALRYTPPGGRVTVRVCVAPGHTTAIAAAIAAPSDTIWLEVEDSGPGIALSERDRVFDRFYRVLGSTADGSGLGLAIVKEIAQKHRATVTILDNIDTHIAPGADESSPGTPAQADSQAASDTPGETEHPTRSTHPGTRIRVSFSALPTSPPDIP